MQVKAEKVTARKQISLHDHSKDVLVTHICPQYKSHDHSKDVLVTHMHTV